jgi:hypothetical protein
MKLEQQVVNLELAKKLKELGVKQDSCFIWSIASPDKAETREEKLVLDKYCEVMLCHKQTDWGKKFEPISAFTVSELGKLLPNNAYTLKVGNERIIKDLGAFVAYYEPDPPAPSGAYHKIYADTEVDARAEMLIYLIETKKYNEK